MMENEIRIEVNKATTVYLPGLLVFLVLFLALFGFTRNGLHAILISLLLTIIAMIFSSKSIKKLLLLPQK
jgi:hypothetical protein